MKEVKIRNRNGSVVGYQIPDEGINRQFQINEVKTIPADELQKLQYVPGGDYLLRHAFVVEDEEMLEDLNIAVEPEYFYTEDDIKRILMEGTLDELEDFLNFATDGGLEIAKNFAVKMELPDVRKRKMISEKTGFFVDTAITINDTMSKESEVPESAKKERKAATPERKAAEPSAPERKSSAPKYKVTKMG